MFSDWAVITLTTTLASPNRISRPTMSLPLMVRSDSVAARRVSRRGRGAELPIPAGHQPAGFSTYPTPRTV